MQGATDSVSEAQVAKNVPQSHSHKEACGLPPSPPPSLPPSTLQAHLSACHLQLPLQQLALCALPGQGLGGWVGEEVVG